MLWPCLRSLTHRLPAWTKAFISTVAALESEMPAAKKSAQDAAAEYERKRQEAKAEYDRKEQEAKAKYEQKERVAKAECDRKEREAEAEYTDKEHRAVGMLRAKIEVCTALSFLEVPLASTPVPSCHKSEHFSDSTVVHVHPASLTVVWVHRPKSSLATRFSSTDCPSWPPPTPSCQRPSGQRWTDLN